MSITKHQGLGFLPFFSDMGQTLPSIVNDEDPIIKSVQLSYWARDMELFLDYFLFAWLAHIDPWRENYSRKASDWLRRILRRCGINYKTLLHAFSFFLWWPRVGSGAYWPGYNSTLVVPWQSMEPEYTLWTDSTKIRSLITPWNLLFFGAGPLWKSALSKFTSQQVDTSREMCHKV